MDMKGHLRSIRAVPLQTGLLALELCQWLWFDKLLIQKIVWQSRLLQTHFCVQRLDQKKGLREKQPHATQALEREHDVISFTYGMMM